LWAVPSVHHQLLCFSCPLISNGYQCHQKQFCTRFQWAYLLTILYSLQFDTDNFEIIQFWLLLERQQCLQLYGCVDHLANLETQLHQFFALSRIWFIHLYYPYNGQLCKKLMSLVDREVSYVLLLLLHENLQTVPEWHPLPSTLLDEQCLLINMHQFHHKFAEIFYSMQWWF
jgi:hypothetical protein